MSKIYVGNLSFGATDETLAAFIRENGVAIETVNIIRDRYTDRSRGFGFVELGDGQSPEEAISILNGKAFDGRTLKVDQARERSDRGGRPKGGTSWD
jgi:RNA recognition motif-containing protein